MYLSATMQGDDARTLAARPRPLGPGMDTDTVARTATLEVWCSSIDDPGEDFCLFRAFDVEARLVAASRVSGY